MLFYGAHGIGNIYKNISLPYGLFNNLERLIKQINAAIILIDDEQLTKCVYNKISKVYDLQCSFYSLFVYCDIIEEIVVGNSKVQLLRIVNINGKERLHVNRIYQAVLYISLCLYQVVYI